jgi:hypothetical protein
MDQVLAQIRRGGIAIMPATVEFSFDEYAGQRFPTISPCHYQPSKIVYSANGQIVDDGWQCAQMFTEYETFEDFAQHYMRMVRTSKKNYLAYWFLTDPSEDPETRMSVDPECDGCQRIVDCEKEDVYRCRTCPDSTYCVQCYRVNIVCQTCGRRGMFDQQQPATD